MTAGAANAGAAGYDRIPDVDGTRDERGRLLEQAEDGTTTNQRTSVGNGEPLRGVEASQAWRQMTRRGKIGMRLLFCMLGAAVLLPFNALITPSEFYRALLKGSQYETSIMSWIIVVYNVACIVFGAHATSTMHKRSIRGRIMSSMSVITITMVLVVVPTSYVIPHPEIRDIGQSYAFPLIIFATFVLATATSYLQVAVVTLANAYGPISMTSMLSGQGVVGAIASTVQLGTTLVGTVLRKRALSEPTSGTFEEASSAAMFFAIAGLVLLLSIIFFRRFASQAVYLEMQAEMGVSKATLSASAEALDTTSTRTQSIAGLRRYMTPAVRRQYERIMGVQRHVVLPCFCIAYIFTVTLAVFPALTSRVRPESASPSVPATRASVLLFVAWHFVVFNTGDLVGRTLPGFIPKRLCLERVGWIALFTVLRSAFVPLLAYCNVDGKANGAHLGSALFFVTVILLGVTNGYLATSVFIVGPTSSRAVQTSEDRALAAALMSWWLTIGLAVGSILSFVVGTA